MRIVTKRMGFLGVNPNYLCYELMQKKPPIKPLKVLDVGCGEGKDAVFLAKTVISLLLLTWQNPGWKREGCWQKRMAPM